jgi:hypothetical protein
MMPPRTTLDVPARELLCTSLSAAFLIFCTLYIFSFCLHQTTHEETHNRHVAARHLGICLTVSGDVDMLMSRRIDITLSSLLNHWRWGSTQVDLLVTFPSFLFVLKVLLPQFAACIVRRADFLLAEDQMSGSRRLQGSFGRRHSTAPVGLHVAVRMRAALLRARERLTERAAACRCSEASEVGLTPNHYGSGDGDDVECKQRTSTPILEGEFATHNPLNPITEGYGEVSGTTTSQTSQNDDDDAPQRRLSLNGPDEPVGSHMDHHSDDTGRLRK